MIFNIYNYVVLKKNLPGDSFSLWPVLGITVWLWTKNKHMNNVINKTILPRFVQDFMFAQLKPQLLLKNVIYN